MSRTADLPLTAAGQAAVDRHQEALAAYADNPVEWRAAYPAMVSAIIEAYARADGGHRRAGVPPLADWQARGLTSAAARPGHNGGRPPQHPLLPRGAVRSESGAEMTILNKEEPAHAAAAGRLQAEPIIWLTTVASSGQPQSTPVWFLSEAGEF